MVAQEMFSNVSSCPAFPIQLPWKLTNSLGLFDMCMHCFSSCLISRSQYPQFNLEEIPVLDIIMETTLQNTCPAAQRGAGRHSIWISDHSLEKER